jgi:uncharacterized membrane protein YhaH (DUF805 family)
MRSPPPLGQMDFQYLYVSFRGRIGRTIFWFGAILLLAIFLGITFVIVYQTRGIPPEIPGMLLVVVQLLLLHPACALMVKRLHNRNRSGYFTAVLFLPLVVERVRYLGSLFGQPERGVVDYFLLGIVLAAGGWFLIELGCLPGTAGPNDYDEDAPDGVGRRQVP